MLSLPQIIEELTPYLVGWRGYFGFCQTPGVYKSGGLDSPKATLIPLAAVGERAQPLQRTAPPWRIAVQSRGRGRFTDGFLAYVRTPSGPSSAAQPPLRLTRSPPTLCSGSRPTRSNRRGARPVCPVVWEGRRRECPLMRAAYSVGTNISLSSKESGEPHAPFGQRTRGIDMAPLLRAPLFMPNGIQGRGMLADPACRWPDAEPCRIRTL